MKQFLFTLLSLSLVFIGYTQANTKLSNLVSPTVVNQSLLPSSSNSKDLRSSSLNWRSFYLKGSMWKGSQRFLSNSGIGNTFLGIQAGTKNTGWYNTAVGDSAQITNINGSYNTALGYKALYSNTSAYSNVAVGSSSLLNNTTGENNIAIGDASMYGNTTGGRNTVVGGNSMTPNKSGNENTAIGFYALGANQQSYNTAVGSQTLKRTGNAQYNTAIGYNAGGANDNGYNNVFLGANTYTNGDGYYNVIALGQDVICTAPSQARIGNAATTSIGGHANWSNISDGRYKKNIKEDVPGLSFITKLRPITYTLDATGLDAFLHRGRSKESLPSAEAKAVMDKALKEKEAMVQTGFVAQEVEKAARESGYNFSGVDKPKNTSDVYGLRYSEFVVPLVRAVQELDSEKTVLKAQLATLNERLNKLEAAQDGNNSLTLNTASLEQNTPNPVRGATTIRYHLPANITSAILNITNAKGQLLKTMTLTSSSSQVNLNTSMLASGTYNYSLIVNGKQVDTKRLVIAR